MISSTEAAAGNPTSQASPSPDGAEPDRRLALLPALLFGHGLALVWRLREGLPRDWPIRHWLKSLGPRLKRGVSRSGKAGIRAVLISDFCATLPRLLAYLGSLALLAIGTSQILRSVPVAAAIDPASTPEWIAVAKPFPAFGLAMPELAAAGSSYGISRHATGGGRKDILTWGELGGSGPHLMVEIYRPGIEFTRFQSAAQEIAARTGNLVAAKDIKPAEALDSKFGAISLVEFSATPDGGRHCLGFARPFDEPHLQIAGWYCMSGPELIERNLVACALDRLTLVAAGSDAKVGEMFARAELKRRFCGQRSPLLASTPNHGPGPSFAPKIRLRGSLSAR